MSERFWEEINRPTEEDTFKGILVKFKDGTDPFLLLTNPNLASAITTIREPEEQILARLLSTGYSHGYVNGEWYVEHDKPRNKPEPVTPKANFLIIEEDSSVEFATKITRLFEKQKIGTMIDELIYRRLLSLFDL